MDDLISREAAIDAIEWGITYAKAINKETGEVRELFAESNEELRKAVNRVEQLPSAQPEIIRCNSCKHWTQTIGEMRGFGLGICDFHNAKYVTCNGFCHWAERRENG